MDQTNLALDLGKLICVLRRKFWNILFAAMLTAGITVVLTYFFATPQYQSSTILHIRNTQNIEELENQIDVIAKLRDSLLEVIKFTQIHRTHNELQEMITVSSVNNTEFIRIAVASPDPYEAETVANAIASILPQRITAILEDASVKVVEEAIVAREATSPNYVRNAVLGFLLGLMLASCSVLLQSLYPEKEKIRSA